MVLMCVYTLIYNTGRYSFPIRMNLVCFIYNFKENIPQKGAYPLHIPISNDCIHACLVNINQLLGDAVQVILLVIPIYFLKILF